jgi:hypothetical protein
VGGGMVQFYYYGEKLNETVVLEDTLKKQN